MTGTLLRFRPATTAALLAIYDDRSTLRHGLAFEAELARAQGAVGLLPAEAAERIAEACRTINVDPAAIAEEAAHAGTLALPLVARLRKALALHPEAAEAVHRGATSQDLADTVMALQAREAMVLLRADLARLARALAALAERYADVPAIGRTLLQDALPITFGLRVSQWLAGIDGARRRLYRESAEALVLQFGGPVGTRTGLGGKGAEVARKLAEALGLPAPAAPWHGRRDRLAGLAVALAIVTGAVGKMARDISLLAQAGVDEAHEPSTKGRGGSSAMPHKRNPTGCQTALSAALRAPGLAAGILAGLPQEQERGLGGWQAEAPALAELFMLAGGAVDAMAVVAEGLDVNEPALARNLAAARTGEDVGEARAIVSAILEDYRKEG